MRIKKDKRIKNKVDQSIWKINSSVEGSDQEWENLVFSKNGGDLIFDWEGSPKYGSLYGGVVD